MRVPIESEAAARAAKRKPGEWKPAILHAALISLFVLGLFYYWFAVADRYAVFLTMTFNQPTLPLLNAIASTAAMLIGLALALPPGAWAAQRPLDLVWLTLDGMGLMPILLLFRAIELPGRGLVSVPVAYAVTLLSVVAGVIGLGVVTALRVRRHTSSVSAMAVFVAGLCLSYLLMPLVHHLFFTPVGYRYITASTNFFARRGDVQLMALFVAVLLAAGVTHLRQRLQLV